MVMQVSPNDMLRGATSVGGLVGDSLVKHRDMVENGDEITAQDEFNRREFEARAGYNTDASFTYTAAEEQRRERNAQAAQAARQVTTNSAQVAREFTQRLNSTINTRIGEIETDMDQLNAALASEQGQLVIQNSRLGAAEHLVGERMKIANREQAEADVETAEAEQAQQATAEVRATNEALRDDWAEAMDAGDIAEANRLAMGGYYTSGRVATLNHLAEEQAKEAEVAQQEADAAQSDVVEAMNQRDAIVERIGELEKSIANNERLLTEYGQELQDLRRIQDSIPDIEEQLASGKITREDAIERLRDEGMSEEMIARLDGQEINGQNIALATDRRLSNIDETLFERHGIPTNGQGIDPNATMTTQYASAAEGITPVEPVTPGMPQPTVTAPGSTYG